MSALAHKYLAPPSSVCHSFLQVDWHMQTTCATTGEGLKEGLDWIAQRLQGDKAPPRRVMR